MALFPITARFRSLMSALRAQCIQMAGNMVAKTHDKQGSDCFNPPFLTSRHVRLFGPNDCAYPPIFFRHSRSEDPQCHMPCGRGDQTKGNPKADVAEADRSTT